MASLQCNAGIRFLDAQPNLAKGLFQNHNDGLDTSLRIFQLDPERTSNA